MDFAELSDSMLPFALNIDGSTLRLRHRAKSKGQSRTYFIEVYPCAPDFFADRG